MVTRRWATALLVGILIAAAVAADAAEVVAQWTMDQSQGGIVADASGNGHDATFFSAQEAAPKFVPGIVGNAVELSEKLEQGFTVAKSTDLNFDGPFTVMAWVKPTRRSGTFEIACMKGDKSGEPPWPGWRLRYFWARMSFQVGTPEGAEPTLFTAEWTVPAGYWSHVAATWDGQKLRGFVNAVERAQLDFDGAIAPQSKSRALILGNYIGRRNAYAFDGLMDELVILKGALTEDEVFDWAIRGMR